MEVINDPFSPANIQKADAFLAQFIDVKLLTPIKEGLTRQMIEYFNSFNQPSERQKKIEKYRQKRHSRQYTPKNHYDCRKKTAESRPRDKGRFVAKNK